MLKKNITPSKVLLEWFDLNQRSFPWRAKAGETPNPYWVWLSEVMLQQTTTASVVPFFKSFVGRWPTVKELASARLDAVLHAWQGLGYYARARNLHQCANIIVSEFGGSIPMSESALLKLPGIGPYTAAAIAAIAFGKIATPVDGNAERVVARLHRVPGPLPKIKGRLRVLATNLTPLTRCGDYAQAVMDLGATICTPRAPSCFSCPWMNICESHHTGDAEGFPERPPRKQKPIRHTNMYYILDKRGRVLIRRREEKGLLGGMMEFPSTDWIEERRFQKDVLKLAPGGADWEILPGTIRHTFTHFHLDIRVLKGTRQNNQVIKGTWCPVSQLSDYALPTVMKKVITHVTKNDSL